MYNMTANAGLWGQTGGEWVLAWRGGGGGGRSLITSRSLRFSMAERVKNTRELQTNRFHQQLENSLQIMSIVIRGNNVMEKVYQNHLTIV